MSAPPAPPGPPAAPAPSDPSGLPGLNRRWSRLVDVPDGSGAVHTWHVLDNGAEPAAGTMLCVHGNPTWSYLWRRFLSTAPPGWRVLAPDHLGMGWSDRTDGPRRFATRVQDLGRLTAALAVDGPVVVAAHDWGGPIGLGWALAHREQVVGLVLANTGVAFPAGTAGPRLIRLARSAALRRRVCRDTSGFVRAAAALARPPLPRPVRAALAAPYAEPDRRQAIDDFVADVPFEPDHPTAEPLAAVADGVRSLAAPALLLWGPRDPVFSERYLDDLRDRLPSAHVHRYPGASHLVIEDRPETAEHAWRWVTALGRTPPQPSVPPGAGSSQGPPWAALTARAGDPAPASVELGTGRRTSFAELEASVRDLGAGLAAAGVRRGDRVAMLVPPGIDLVTAVYACWRIGAVIVVADAGLGVRRLGDALRSARPAWVIGIGKGLLAARVLGVPGRRISVGPVPRAAGADLELAGLRNAGRNLPLPGEPDPDDEAAVLFTSGATGPPKGVVYRSRQLAEQIRQVGAIFAARPGDTLVAAFAPFALWGPALGIGAVVPDVDPTAPGTLTAAKLADAVAAMDATLAFASPAALRNVVATAEQTTATQREALGRVRVLLSAGAPVPVSLLRQVQSVLPNAELHTPYGMTEVLPVTDVTLPDLDEAGPGNGVCVGRPLPGVEVLLSPLGPDGTADGALTAGAGVTGEVCVRAAHAKDRYDRLWATESVASRNPGWHRTGDVGHLDDSGRLWVEGRLVHVLTTADGPLTPVGVEQRVEGVDRVRAAAAVGVGPAGTQQLVVVVVTGDRSPVLADPGLAAAVRTAAAVPVAAVLVAGSLPVDIRHASKVDRTRLARWADRVLSGASAGRP